MRVRFAFLLVALAGCSFDSAAVVETVDNRCGSDADCQAGVCDGDICIDDSNAVVELVIEVLGSSAEAHAAIPASWVFEAERFSGSSVRDLVLPATREVRGTVRWDGLRVPATLRFVRRMPGSVTPLEPVPVEVNTLREPAGGDGPESYDFSAVLVAGETYDVVVLPTSDMVMSPTNASAPAIRSLPPLYLEATVEGGDGTDPFRFDVSFPAGLTEECTDSRETTCTLEANVVSFDGEVEMAEPGLQVRAIDANSSRVVSSIAETDESGRFAIRLGEDATDYLIRVTSSAGREPFPAVSVDPEVAFANDPVEKVIYIPRLSPVQLTGRVSDEEGAAVPGATVRLLSNGIFGEGQLGLQGSFSNSTTTNEDGTFGVELLSGYYALTVTPPDDVETAWGVLSSDALVGQQSTTVDPLVVPSKLELFGSVRTFQDDAAAGVAVTARARTGTELASAHRSQEAVSDGEGVFAMLMDLGLYDMQVKIPSESGYPWLVEPALVMEQDLARNYLLQPPIRIEGAVIASGGAPVPDTLIRASVLTADGSSTRLIQVAETVSNEEGSYRLLIAPRLGDE